MTIDNQREKVDFEMSSSELSFESWKNKILFWGITAGVAALISWISWVTIAVTTKPDQSDVRQIIETSAPYVADRKMIEQRLKVASESAQDTRKVIERNTEAINLLRIELAKIASTERN